MDEGRVSIGLPLLSFAGLTAWTYRSSSSSRASGCASLRRLTARVRLRRWRMLRVARATKPAARAISYRSRRQRHKLK
jgi:hypothetical protein